MTNLTLSKEELCLISIALNEYQMETDNYHLDEMRKVCLLYTSPSPRDRQKSRMPSSA